MATLDLHAHNIGPSNVLFQRYDSFSTSSGSKRSSIASTGSAGSSSSRRSDRTGQRRNNITNVLMNSDPLSSNKTQSNILSGNNKNDNDDDCLFCHTMVNERQYYMWQSNYTKSSFCARCKEENNSLQYISYWGTSDYQTGSWRKRYRDGRSSDIDLTPLLEVLDRIDLIDTSICGMTSKLNHTVAVTNANADKTDKTWSNPVEMVEIDYNLTERRQRRLLNRETLARDAATSSNITHILSEKNSHIAVENSDVFKSEHIRTIAPLEIMQANEIINQPEPFNITHPRNDFRSVGKTSYEEFIAGLDNDSKIHRTSTSKYALVDVVNSRDKRTHQQESGRTDNSRTVRPNEYCSDINCNEKLGNGNQAYINTNKNDKMATCDTNGNINDDFKTDCISSRSTCENEQTKRDCNSAETELRNEINEVSQRCNKQINHNQDSVLGYKRKSLKQRSAYKAHCVARRRSKTEINYKIPESITENDETTNVEELSFRDKRRKFEMMQSTDCQQKRNTPGGSFSRSAKPRRNSRDNKTTNGEEPREPITILQTNNIPDPTTESGSSEDGNNANLIRDDDPCCEPGIKEQDAFEISERENSSIKILTQNKHQVCTDSKKTEFLKMDDEISQSGSSSEDSEDSFTNNKDIDLDISTAISTTDYSSNRSSLSVQTEISKQDYDSSEILAHYKKVHSGRHSARRSWGQESMQQDKEYAEKRTDDETSDVPHIERIKKKLGRIKNDEDNESDENGNCVELDVSDNEQMELSWRTRGYNADFFMSRQSVTGSEILDRYKRALSKRRIRKKYRSKDCSSRTSVDMDEQMTDSREPNTRKTATRRNFNRSDDVDTISNSSNAGVNPMALKEALNRAAACSKRFSKRLRKQLNESSCDSSS